MVAILAEVLRESLQNAEDGWSMGSFGAIAEFHQDAGESLVIDNPNELTRATSRGAMRIDCSQLEAVHPIAYEALSPKAHRWSHALALCLPADAARRGGRAVLTALGEDAEAIQEQDRNAQLFDMGLGLTQCDFCIRTGDPDLISVLNQYLGRSLLDPDNPAMGMILTAHPNRVAITNIGRVEVYQKIGGPETGGVSPAGPHTHVLPKLIRSGQTHSANAPIPEGLVPCGYLHPGHPVIDTLGRDRAFVPELHERFQALMSQFGRPDIVDRKRAAIEAVKAGKEPDAFPWPDDRHVRAGVRIGLRQFHHVATSRQDAQLSDRVKRWRKAFDGHPEFIEDDEQSQHDAGRA